MQFLNPSDKAVAMDYGSALASAVAWLGNRYLLASPARRLTPSDAYRRGPASLPDRPCFLSPD
jgi:hypothetical protein